MDKNEVFGRVYRVVATIPKGRVLTYGQIAFLIGCPGQARRVGQAMANAPDGLPCHRVVSSQGGLAPPYAFGDRNQRCMLEQEGVQFRKNGSVDLRSSLWKISESEK